MALFISGLRQLIKNIKYSFIDFNLVRTIHSRNVLCDSYYYSYVWFNSHYVNVLKQYQYKIPTYVEFFGLLVCVGCCWVLFCFVLCFFVDLFQFLFCCCCVVLCFLCVFLVVDLFQLLVAGAS